MTPALPATPAPRTHFELFRALHERVADWSDGRAAAAAAAAFLREELRHPSVAVYAHEPATGSLVLLAADPAGPRGAAVGASFLAGTDAVGTAASSGEPQRSINAYVEPDFVRSLPGETRSELAVPIATGAAVRGVLYLEYPSPHRPGPRDEEVAELAAAQLAAAWEAAGGEGGGGAGALRQEHFAALSGIARHLAQSSDLPGTLQRVAECALALVPGEGAAVLLRHGDRQGLEVAATAGSIPLAPGTLFPMDAGIAADVLRSVCPRAATNLAAEPFGPNDAQLGLRDALAVPLCAAGKSFGVLAVLNRADAADDAEAVELLQGLASQAAGVEPMRQIGPLRQRLSDGSILAEVGRAVTGTLGLDEVLSLVVRTAEMLIGARGVAIGMVDDERTHLSLVSTGGALRSSKGQRLPLHDTLMGWVVITGECAETPNVSDDPRGYPHEKRQGPAAAVPLECRGKIRGVLLATRAEGEPPPSDEDLDALRKLGAYAAIAIDNARLYREQTELSQALLRQTEELERAYAELRESQERLLVSEKMAALGRLTAGIAHEINSPLGGILNCLQLAQQYAGEYQSSVGDPEVTAEDHAGIAKDLLEALTMAEAATRKVGQFVRTIKGQTRTGDSEEGRPFDPGEEIEGTLTLLQHEIRNRHVTLHTEIERGLRLVGSSGKFALIVQNLVSNAIDAYEGSAGEVRVRLKGGESALVLEVEDRGCGIPEDIRGRIFDYLFTTKDVGQGTGLGLSIVHSIVTSHFRGEIDLRSEVGSGTTFCVTFPVPTEND